MSLNTFCKDFLKELHENEGYVVVAVTSPDEILKDIRSCLKDNYYEILDL